MTWCVVDDEGTVVADALEAKEAADFVASWNAAYPAPFTQFHVAPETPRS